MGLTEKGYTRPTYNDIVENFILKAQELFGADIETNEQTPLGKFIRIIAYDRAVAEEEAEAIYYARFPNTASGTSLDRLCPFVGIERNPATPSQYEVTVTGTAGYTVPYGFLVSTESDINFYNTMDTVIDENGTCVITVECTEAGENGNIPAQNITNIVNPDADISSIIGKSVVALGKNTESDYELRQRFKQARVGLGSCNETAIKAALLRVPTVTSVNITVDEANGSFTCYVSGGEDYEQQIAETIFDKKPIGIKTTGTTSYTVIDDGGYEHTIYFSKTENINVSVQIKLNKTADFEGETGQETIKDNIKKYINALGVGNDVVLSALYGYIYSVKGVKEVTELKLSTNGTDYSTENISITQYQNAVCTNVSVEVS